MKTKNEKDTRQSFIELIRTLVAVIEEKDVFMSGHAERVAVNSNNFCKQLDHENKENLDKIYFAGLLMDIGMIFLPNRIMQKQGKLAHDEIIMVRQHPDISVKILSNVSFLKDVLPIIRHHHEAFDGTGYPDGLKGEDIPLGARILNLFISYEAITSVRPHRVAMTSEQALEEIYKRAGKQFDNSLINSFVEFVKMSEPDAKDDVKARIQQKEEMADTSFQDIFEGIIKKFKTGKLGLPVLPQIFQEIKKIIGDENASAEDLAKVIEKDAVISVRLLSLSNSPYYRGINEVDTVRIAVSRLGVKQVDEMVSGIANKNLYETKNPLFRRIIEDLWRHSLASAYASKFIAKELMFEDLEKFFLMGLMHDIGKILLLKALSETRSLRLRLKRQDIVESMQEYHCEFGEFILQQWKFDKAFVEIAKSHEGNVFPASTKKEILVVNLANYLTRNINYSLFDEKYELGTLKSVELLGIELDIIEKISEKVCVAMKDSAQFF